MIGTDPTAGTEAWARGAGRKKTAPLQLRPASSEGRVKPQEPAPPSAPEAEIAAPDRPRRSAPLLLTLPIFACGAAFVGASYAPTGSEHISVLPVVVLFSAFALEALWLPSLVALGAVLGDAASGGAVPPAALVLATMCVAGALTYAAYRVTALRPVRPFADDAVAAAEGAGPPAGEVPVADVASTILAAVNGFTAASEPAEIASRIAAGATELVGATGALLLLWDETVDTFRIGAIAGGELPGARELRQVEIPVDRVPTLRPAGPGEVVLVEASAWREPMLHGIFRRWRATSLAGARLQCGDQLHGLLFVARDSRQAPFAPRDRDILAGIALHAAAALARVNLAADLQAANQLKQEFMATMSHELRTPLNVILGYTELQIDGVFGDLAAEQFDTVQRIRDQALRLLELIQATLDMSRLERGLLTIDLREVSVPKLMEQLETQVPRAWRRPTVELIWRVNPGLPTLRTDPAKLQTILRNLIHNALKFTQHGVVTVSVSAHGNRPYLAFVVQDSGVGIKAEHLSEIFDMFRQVPESESVPVAGVGLGLYIVKRLASVLGAEIEVSSAPRRGATFRILVPIEGPLVAVTPQPSSEN